MIPLFKVFMSPEAGKAATDTMYSGMVTQGPKVEAFEYELKRYFDVKNILTLNSGTSALQLAVKLAGGDFGKKVISTPMTCTATNTAIRSTGADILWADIDPLTGNIDPEYVRRLLEAYGDQVMAVMAVDWGGNPCPWKELRRIADLYRVALIEDAAHGFGAEYEGKKLGHIADFTCYSFQAIKHMTTIDGGALICNNDSDHRRGKLLRWFGIDRDQPRADFRCEADVIEPGFKYHMNDVTASIGLAQLPHMDAVVGTHRQNGKFYDSRLEGTSAFIPKIGESSYWIYTIHINNRDTFMSYMKDRGIQTSQVHARNDSHTMFANYKRDLPGVDEFTATQVNIPCGWWISPEMAEYIVESVLTYLESETK